jgi:hypothetical protein
MPAAAVLPSERGGARDQQRLPLRRAQMEELREQGTHRAARNDDRSFGTERPARADRHSRGERLEHGHFRRHPAAADQDRLHGLRDAVTADFF